MPKEYLSVLPVVTACLSTIAAICSAVTAYFVYRIHQRNLMESLRPELVIQEWYRDDTKGKDHLYEKIMFKQIRNVGRGAAFDVVIGSEMRFKSDKTGMISGGSNARRPVVASNECIDVNYYVMVNWLNIEPDPDTGTRNTSINLDIICTNYNNISYKFTYTIMACYPILGDSHGDLGNSLNFSRRVTTQTPVWRLRIKNKTKKLRLHIEVMKVLLTQQMEKLKSRLLYKSSSPK